MSDYEKEKLKEFLRNKRPKRSLNSNNESNKFSNENSKFDDKFKNSNNLNSLNLKEDLNLEKQDFKDNSNLNNKNSTNNTSNFKNPNSQNSSSLDNSSNSHNQNNTQISDNKNSNKRDYDENPIVIKNYSVMNLLFYIIIAIIIPSIFIKISYNYGVIDFYYGGRTYLLYHKNSTFILSTLILFFVSIYCYSFKESDIIINNSYVTYFGSSLDGLDIRNINENSFVIGNYKTKINFLCLIFICFSLAFNLDYEGILFAISFIFVRFFPIFLFSFFFFQNKSFKFYNPRYLSIKTKQGNKIIPLFLEKDTEQVKEYFLKKLEINIDKKINYLM